MKLSVVILTWNSEDCIGTCLQSLLGVLDEVPGDCEIYVIDNGSVDTSREIVEKFSRKHPDIFKPIYLDKNTGTTFSRNLALRQVTGDCIAVLDSDVIVSPGTFRELLTILSQSPQTGMVVPKLVYRNGRYQKSTDDFPTLFTKLRRYFFLKDMERSEGKHASQVNHTVDYAISAFWLLKKEVLDTVGLLDENIFYAPEDVDYCLRIWKAGYRILYVPTCEVVHDAREISRGFKINRAFREHVKGLAYYFFKHKYLLRKPELHEN